MAKFVSLDVVPLKTLFSGLYRFKLPWFQRAYAWQSQEVSKLLTDLLDAVKRVSSSPHYLLGTVVLGQKIGEASTAIVDGHQRTMTLTILFAVLRDMETSAEYKAKLNSAIGNPNFVFEPQEGCAEICREYVQQINATAKLFDGDYAELSETENNILENRDQIKKLLSSEPVDAALRRQLADYLLERCFVILHVFRDQNEAWTSVRIEEDTRHEFSPAALAKSSLTSYVPPGDRVRCGEIWEECETLLSAEDLYFLLEHMRSLNQRKPSAHPLESEIAQLYQLNKDGIKFFETQLLPLSRQLNAVRTGNVGKGQTRSEISAYLDRITWIEPQAAVPAALHWLSKRGDGGDAAQFFRKLEGLVWMMRISGLDGTKKQARIFKLLQEIDQGAAVSQMQGFDFDKSMIATCLENLKSPTFDKKHYCKAVLRRISIALGADSGKPCPVNCTLEHILPRGRKTEKSWKQVLTGKAQKSYAHQLGNLTFLTAMDNNRAANEPWAVKRGIYAQSGFILSSELRDVEAWDTQAIKARTDRMARLLLGAWGVQI